MSWLGWWSQFPEFHSAFDLLAEMEEETHWREFPRRWYSPLMSRYRLVLFMLDSAVLHCHVGKLKNLFKRWKRFSRTKVFQTSNESFFFLIKKLKTGPVTPQVLSAPHLVPGHSTMVTFMVLNRGPARLFNLSMDDDHGYLHKRGSHRSVRRSLNSISHVFISGCHGNCFYRMEQCFSLKYKLFGQCRI